MSIVKMTKTDQDRIAAAVKKAESTTAGEIATAIIRESDDYSFQELLFALLFGFLNYALCMSLYAPISLMLDSVFWSTAEWYTAAFIGISTMLATGIFFLVANIPAIDRLIVSRKKMAAKVKDRAVLHFSESGMINTRDRTGILFFVSVRERRVELIADSGISAKVSQETWDEIIGKLLIKIKAEQFADGLCEAVLACGEILTEFFPIKADDENELSDGVQLLED